MKTRTRPAARRGFSLIELLVVISIIGILSGLLLAGVGRVRVAAQRAQVVSDIAQLDTAVSSFKSKFSNVSYIPAGGSGSGGKFLLKSTYTGTEPEAVYLKQLFPRMNGLPPNNGTGQTTGLPNGTELDSNQCLVFFLTGGVTTSFSGFSNNPQLPFSGGGGIPAFVNLPASRLTADGHYLDIWGTPYAYFTFDSNNPTVYSGANAGFTNGAFKDPTGRFEKPRGCQIISAGPNKQFGPGGNYMSLPEYEGTAAGADDLANFAQAGNIGR